MKNTCNVCGVTYDLSIQNLQGAFCPVCSLRAVVEELLNVEIAACGECESCTGCVERDENGDEYIDLPPVGMN